MFNMITIRTWSSHSVSDHRSGNGDARYLAQKRFKLSQSWMVVGILFLLMLVLAGQQVKGYYQMNHTEYLRAGKAVDAQNPPDALVIAPAFGDTQFLFQTNRRGWPIGFGIDDKIRLGAQYYVTTTMDDEANELQKYFTLLQTQEYLILDLQRPASQ